jgi:hypothetical protein
VDAEKTKCKSQTIWSFPSLGKTVSKEASAQQPLLISVMKKKLHERLEALGYLGFFPHEEVTFVHYAVIFLLESGKASQWKQFIS